MVMIMLVDKLKNSHQKNYVDEKCIAFLVSVLVSLLIYLISRVKELSESKRARIFLRRKTPNK